MNSKEVDIILVWGTFANNAKWVQKGSSFRTNLRRRLETLSIHPNFFVHDWNSDNSHEARLRGAESLAQRVESLKSLSENDVFIIGHSHGGTISNMAIRMLSSSNFPCGLVTLGTPFLILNRRSKLMSAIILISLCFPAISILMALASIWFDVSPGTAIIASVGASACITYLVYKKWVKLTYRAEDQNNAFGLSVSLSEFPVLCFSTFPDEATLLLTFWTSLSVALQVFIATVVGIFTYSYYLVFTQPQPDDFSMWTGDFELLWPYIYATAMIFFILFLTPLIAWLIGTLRGKWFAFGGEGAFWHTIFRIRISSLPNTSSEYRARWYFITWLRLKKRHSMFYEDSGISDQIAFYISNKEISSSKVRWYWETITSNIFFKLLYVVLAIGAISVFYG